MTDKSLTSEQARELGKRSAAARRAKAAARLTLFTIEEAFGELATLEDAQRRLERLSVWAAAGMLSGTVAHAAVRAVEVWIRAHESRLTSHVVEDLKHEVDRLKAELKGRPSVKAVRLS